MQIKCTSCGATQELAANHQCGYCGSAIEQEKAQENYKSSTTGEVGNLIMMAETAVDATNWEEALQYYNKALEKDITNSDAWLGKGIAMVYTSKIGDIKTKEAIAYWKNAIKHAENADAMGKRVAKEINTVVNAFYPAIENHYIEFSGLDNSYQELVSRFATLESAQDYATQLDGENISYHETGYALCKRVIDLPKKYASAAHSSALAEGIVGQFTSNQYSRKYAAQEARGKMNKANERKLEIARAAIIIEQIQDKYIASIKRINPNTNVSSSKETFIIETFKKENSLLNTENKFNKEFVVTADEAKKVVRDVLLKNGLISEDKIQRSEKLRTIGGVVVIIFIVLYFVLAYYLKE
jgi:tetratricopeptide (TPR) repeat protein